MIGLEVIKQGLENNKKGISSNLLKKIALLKIEERFQNSLNSYSIMSNIERIAESNFDENEKETLMKMLKDGLLKASEDMSDSLKELFGTSENKEEPKEDDKEEKKEDEPKDEPDQDQSENGIPGPRETPAENVINNNDENDHRVIFNY